MLSRPNLLRTTLLMLTLHGTAEATAADFAADRNRMVDEEIVAAGVKDPRVIEAMREHAAARVRAAQSAGQRLLRHGLADRRRADDLAAVHRGLHDRATRSPADRQGAGDRHRQRLSGGRAQPAGQGGLHDRDRRAAWAQRAARALKRLNYENVHAKVGDGYQGWPEHAPFDKIIVTCSPEKVPPKLVEQLREGGRMVIPVGERYQQTLYLLKKKDGKLNREALLPTLFVPMTGQAEEGREVLPDPANPRSATAASNSSSCARRSGCGQARGRREPPEMIPDGWHYQRQLKLIEAANAPEGKHYVTVHQRQPRSRRRRCKAWPSTAAR